VRVEVTDRATGVEETVTAEYVLGCDGANSLVRGVIGASMRDLNFEQRWLVVDVATDANLGQWEGAHQVCDPVRAATYMRIGPTRYRWEFRLAAGETAEDYRDIARLHPLLAPWTGNLPVDRLEIGRVAEYTFRAQVADRWRDRRVFLLGDAAHLTPPFIGQGLGLGIGDAHGAAWRVAALVRGAADQGVLDEYARERAAHARAVIKTALRVGHAMTGGSGAAAAVRRHLSAALLRIPVVRARAEATTTVRYARRRGLTGTACPQPLVRHGGRVQPLDDVLGRGFVLLHTGPIDPDLLARARHLQAHRIDLDDTLDDGTLRAWLRRGRARAVLLRPDRVVLATGR
jgi:3-(3-hydroxy-phenyl)propionate hydroxylase